jgi:hypothetical protein
LYFPKKTQQAVRCGNADSAEAGWNPDRSLWPKVVHMPSQYRYRTTICNEYLGVSKVIRAMTRGELQWLVEAQLSKWTEQEERKRQQRQKEAERLALQQYAKDLKWLAEEDTKAAQQRLDTFRNILSGSLTTNLTLDWESMLDRRSFRPFQFTDPKPDRSVIRLQLLGPAPTERLVASPAPEKASILEFVLPLLRRRRLEREA